MIVDLHCHTDASDNSMTILQVLRLAKDKSVSHLAITDHDTTAGLAEALKLGAELNIEIIPGIEISTYDEDRKIRAHILGYYIQPEHPAIKELCSPLSARRHEACRRMVNILMEKGYNITWEKVKRISGSGGVYKQHIMHALVEEGYCSEIYSPLYKKLFYRGDEKTSPGSAFVPIEYVLPEDAIKAIRAASGVPVLAHPAQFENFDAVPQWVAAGLEGIEVKHPKHGEQEEKRAMELAAEFNLVTTGGADFHGFYSNHPYQPGSKNPGIKSVYALWERKQKVMKKTASYLRV